MQVTFTDAQAFAVYSAIVEARDAAKATALDPESGFDKRGLAAARFTALSRAANSIAIAGAREQTAREAATTQKHDDLRTALGMSR